MQELLEKRSRKVLRLINSEKALYKVPLPSTRTFIPKRGTSELRSLTYPTMLDRAKETKILFVIMPQVSKEYMVDESIGFWSNRDRIRGLTSFISRAISTHGENNYELFSVDIAKYFGSIPEVSRRQMMSSIYMPKAHKDYVVNSMIMPFYDAKSKRFEMWPKGSASSEGSVLLPTIANMYLHKYDQGVKGLGLVFCRYADNMVFALPKAGMQGIPWDTNNLSRFVETNIQQQMPLGITVHSLNRPEKTHLIKPGTLELGVYLQPEANTIDAVMTYGDGCRNQVEVEEYSKRIIGYKTPILDRFIKEWHKSYPPVPSIKHAFNVETYYNSGDELILSIQLHTDRPRRRADPHDVARVLSYETPRSLTDLTGIIESVLVQAQNNPKTVDRINKAIQRVCIVYRRVIREARMNQRQRLHYLNELKSLTNQLEHEELFERVGERYPQILKAWKQELYGIDKVALS
jgi:hypothetical protein